MRVRLIPEGTIVESVPELTSGIGDILVWREDLKPRDRFWESRAAGSYEAIWEEK
jgi:hypothetical protein